MTQTESLPGRLTPLKRRGLLFDRGAAGGYCLWPNTSVNLEVALEAARRALGSIEKVSDHIRQFLEESPLLARRHYIGNRHFTAFRRPLRDTSNIGRRSGPAQ